MRSNYFCLIILLKLKYNSMARSINIFSNTIGRKLVVALTGLFLILFLVIHLIGNLQLLKGDPDIFNAYTYTMVSSPIIKIASYITYLSIILHIIYAIILKRINAKARPQNYAYNKPSENSSWSSRSMFLLGSVIFIFIVLHMGNFWFKYKFGEIGMAGEYKDMYTVVATSFQQWWYVAIYVLAMVGLGYHLIHGFQSAFQTLGLNHRIYTPTIQKAGFGFSILVPALYALIPLYMFFTS